MPRKKVDYTQYLFPRENGKYIVPEEYMDKRIPVINLEKGEKRFGSTAPWGRMLNEYLQSRPDFVVLDSNEKNVKEDRVILWNSVEERKLSGKSAPLRVNLEKYLLNHPGWEVFSNQKPSRGNETNPEQHRVLVWDKKKRRKLTGNAMPRRKFLNEFLAKHEHYEEYIGQDGKEPRVGKKRSATRQLEVEDGQDEGEDDFYYYNPISGTAFLPPAGYSTPKTQSVLFEHEGYQTPVQAHSAVYQESDAQKPFLQNPDAVLTPVPSNVVLTGAGFTNKGYIDNDLAQMEEDFEVDSPGEDEDINTEDVRPSWEEADAMLDYFDLPEPYWDALGM